MGLAVAAASQTARSRMRRLVVDHFFTARYDYRREWLRCVDTLSSGEAGIEAPVRAIRAIADPADSPAGTLLLRDPSRWARSRGDAAAVSLGRIVEHAAASRPRAARRPCADRRAEGGRLGGAARRQQGGCRRGHADRTWPRPGLRQALACRAAAAPPRGACRRRAARHRRALPSRSIVETFDLLRTLGQEVAMFLAERRAAERLVDQRQLQDYAKRFAFVAHDVKTVSSQLSLLLANAEDNIADPDFQHDMLLTVRASAERINALIARLRQPEAETGAAAAGRRHQRRGASRDDRRRRQARDSARQRRPHPIVIGAGRRRHRRCRDRRRAVRHRRHPPARQRDRGLPARRGGARSRVSRHDADGQGRIVVDITDRGPGMSPEFVRDQLFRPLATSKPQGSGIGAWQARELLREAGGDLSVLSQPGRRHHHAAVLHLPAPAMAPRSRHPRERHSEGFAHEQAEAARRRGRSRRSAPSTAGPSRPAAW